MEAGGSEPESAARLELSTVSELEEVLRYPVSSAALYRAAQVDGEGGAGPRKPTRRLPDITGMASGQQQQQQQASKQSRCSGDLIRPKHYCKQFLF